MTQGNLARQAGLKRLRRYSGTWQLEAPSGNLIDLELLGAGVYSVSGAGAAPIELQIRDGRFQGVTAVPRELVLCIDPAALTPERTAELIAVCYEDPQLRRPLTLYYLGATRTLMLPVRPLPLTRQTEAERGLLRLVALASAWQGSDPLLTLPLHVVRSLPTATTVATEESGTWVAAGSGPGGTVRALAYGPDGKLYAGGQFGGGLKVFQAGSWATVGGGVNGSIDCMVWGPDNKLYVGGGFSSAGGVAAQNIAAYDLTTGTWAAVAGGLPGVVYALTIGYSSTGATLYAGGTFAGGLALRALPGGAWANQGLTGQVYALLADAAGGVVVGGAFNEPGDLRSILYLQHGMRVRMSEGFNGIVRCLARLPDGRIVAGGEFTASGAEPCPYIAAWAGTRWTPLNGPGSLISSSVHALAAGPDGKLYAGGLFGQIVELVGRQWQRCTVRATPATPTYALARQISGVSATLAASFADSPTLTAQGITWAPQRPPAARFGALVLRISGPGRLYRVTGPDSDTLYLDLDLQPGETLTISMDDRRITSSLRGDLTGALAPGSAFWASLSGGWPIAVHGDATVQATLNAATFWHTLDAADATDAA